MVSPMVDLINAFTDDSKDELLIVFNSCYHQAQDWLGLIALFTIKFITEIKFPLHISWLKRQNWL